MARYTLDYSDPPISLRRRAPREAHRFPVLLALLGLCIGLIALIYAFHLRGENHYLRHQHNAQTLRYDSLLAAKLHADRLLVGGDSTRRLPRLPESNQLLIQD